MPGLDLILAIQLNHGLSNSRNDAHPSPSIVVPLQDQEAENHSHVCPWLRDNAIHGPGQGQTTCGELCAVPGNSLHSAVPWAHGVCHHPAWLAVTSLFPGLVSGCSLLLMQGVEDLAWFAKWMHFLGKTSSRKTSFQGKQCSWDTADRAECPQSSVVAASLFTLGYEMEETSLLADYCIAPVSSFTWAIKLLKDAIWRESGW